MPVTGRAKWLRKAQINDEALRSAREFGLIGPNRYQRVRPPTVREANYLPLLSK